MVTSRLSVKSFVNYHSLEALLREIRSGSEEELLYADELVSVNETLKGLKGRLKPRKGVLESKGLRVNVKTK